MLTFLWLPSSKLKRRNLVLFVSISIHTFNYYFFVSKLELLSTYADKWSHSRNYARHNLLIFETKKKVPISYFKNKTKMSVFRGIKSILLLRIRKQTFVESTAKKSLNFSKIDEYFKNELSALNDPLFSNNALLYDMNRIRVPSLPKIHSQVRKHEIRILQ